MWETAKDMKHLAWKMIFYSVYNSKHHASELMSRENIVFVEYDSTKLNWAHFNKEVES